MATNSSNIPAVMALQAPLLSLAYSLTGDRTEAYNLLRDTTRRVMATPSDYTSRESLFAAMKSIFNSSYSTRAARHRVEVATRPYKLPVHAAMADAADEIPEGTVSAAHATGLISSILDRRYSRAMAMRAAGYRYREIAREAGITVLGARIRVAFAAISLRAAASLGS